MTVNEEGKDDEKTYLYSISDSELVAPGEVKSPNFARVDDWRERVYLFGPSGFGESFIKSCPLPLDIPNTIDERWRN